jgi:hypothetical protein
MCKSLGIIKEFSSPRDKKNRIFNIRKTLEKLDFSRVFFILLFV